MQEHLANPPLWISETDKRGNRVLREVIEAAHRIWNRVLQYLRRENLDVTPAAEILEETCHCVSRAIRRNRKANHVRDLDSYLFWSFARKYSRRMALEERIRYVDNVQSISDGSAKADRSWAALLHDKILVKQFLGFLEPKFRVMMICRSQGESWAEIGLRFGISAHNAEVQFGKAIKKARRRFFGLG